MKPWSSKQYFFLEMGGFVVQTSSTSDALCFDVNTIAHLITQNIVDPPTITDKDIDDRSKSNWLTKSLALIQVTYFLVQLLGRAIYKLPTTTLELFTLGIIVCAVITYVAWWKKPFDVQTPVILQARAQDYAWPPTTTKDFNYLVSGKPNKKDCQRNTSVCVVISLCFTATHFIGWNFHFATEVETWAWRCSSVVCAVLPIYYITVKLTASLDGLDKAWLTVYILARVVLLVEVCIGLRSVPPGVYQTVPWSQYFPSLS
jgi:magnesium-transporting ATPase (P-type)